MKAVGKIGNIQVLSRTTKQTSQGIPYDSERVIIYFESGDDTHMVQVFNSVFSGHTSEETLLKRNLFIGARGEMIIRYGFRDWQGKQYPDVELVKFTCDNPQRDMAGAPASEPTDQPEATVQQVAEGMAEAAQAAEANINPETKLPF